MDDDQRKAIFAKKNGNGSKPASKDFQQVSMGTGYAPWKDTAKLSKKELQNHLKKEGVESEIENTRTGDHMGTDYGVIIELSNGNEYVVYNNYEDAEYAVKQNIRENIEQGEPDEYGGFSKDFISYYMDMSDTDIRLWASDLADSRMDGVESIEEIKELADQYNVEYQDDDTIESEIQEAPKLYGLTESDVDDMNEKYDEIVEQEIDKNHERIEDEIKEEVRNKIDDEIEKELKDDARGYIEQEFGEEEYDRLVENGTFRVWGDDINRLADDAIANDGLGNFLSSYDGNYDELPDGKIITRIN